jgi:hypothetical protein
MCVEKRRLDRILGLGAVSQDMEAIGVDAFRVALEQSCCVIGGGAPSEPHGNRHIVLQVVGPFSP